MNHLYQSLQRCDRMPSSSRQRGASLLEGIAYLGIAAVVVLGAVSLLGGAFSSAKSNQATEEAVAMRTAVRKLYIGQSYPVESLVPTLIAANAIPSTLAKNNADNTLKTAGAAPSLYREPPPALRSLMQRYPRMSAST